jgi:kynurenine aminotransferase
MSLCTPLLTTSQSQPVMTGPLISKSYGPSPLDYSRCLVERYSRRAAITPRTKVIIVNTPHNPVGKVYTRSELEKIAALAQEFNLLVMADEVVRSEFPCCPGHPLNVNFPVRLPGL